MEKYELGFSSAEQSYYYGALAAFRPLAEIKPPCGLRAQVEGCGFGRSRGRTNTLNLVANNISPRDLSDRQIDGQDRQAPDAAAS